MRAAVLHEFGSPLVIEDRAVPVPGTEDVLIQVEACGVCHSDLHLAAGEWARFAVLMQRPLILGHEIVGRVVDRGKSVRDVQIGSRVGVPWLFWSCGECAQCRAGRENICAARKITGVTVDGGFAEFVRAPASHVTRVQESLDSVEAAPLFCAGVTVHRAIKNAGVERGQRVGVFGIGGLGHLAVQLARHRGAEVIALDLAEDKLKLARESGAAKTLPATSDSAKELRAAGGVHFALVTAGAKAAYDLALQCLAPGGALVVIGLPAEPLSFDAGKLASGENRILSSAVGTRQDVRETLDLAAAGHLRCHVEPRPLESVNDALAQMRRAQLTGRVVLRFTHDAPS
jgi:propanol-preferring alcohol dehydrogenase